MAKSEATMRKALANAVRSDSRDAVAYSVEVEKKNAITIPTPIGRKSAVGDAGSKPSNAACPRIPGCGSRHESMWAAPARLVARKNTIVELRKVKVTTHPSQPGISSFRRVQT